MPGPLQFVISLRKQDDVIRFSCTTYSVSSFISDDDPLEVGMQPNFSENNYIKSENTVIKKPQKICPQFRSSLAVKFQVCHKMYVDPFRIG